MIFNKDNIFFCGDIHGEFSKLGFLIKERYKFENSIIFVCGDFGMGFYKPNYYNVELGKLSKILEKKNNHIIAIRGNHDDPSYFKEIKSYGNVILIPDYTVVNVNHFNILGIGGAISVDRKGNHRVLNKTYWVDEIINVDEEKIKSFFEIDIVFTHSAPNFCEPFTKESIYDWISKDMNLIPECNKERGDLTYIYDVLKENNNIKNWYYGHFHDSYNFINENKTNFIGLNIEEIKIF